MQDLRREADYLSVDGLVALIDARLHRCVLKINVSGTVFTTSRATIAKGSEHLQSLVLPEGHNVQLDEQGLPFIDANPAAFHGILQFLRLGWIAVNRHSGAYCRALSTKADFKRVTGVFLSEYDPILLVGTCAYLHYQYL